MTGGTDVAIEDQKGSECLGFSKHGLIRYVDRERAALLRGWFESGDKQTEYQLGLSKETLRYWNTRILKISSLRCLRALIRGKEDRWKCTELCYVELKLLSNTRGQRVIYNNFLTIQPRSIRTMQMDAADFKVTYCGGGIESR